MTPLPDLWLPFLLAIAIVFIASSIIHMAPLWHKNEYPILPNQDNVLDAIRSLGIPAGDYVLPRPANNQEMRTPEFQERMRRGPVVIMTVAPGGPWMMGSTFFNWIIFIAVVTLFAAYIGSRALAPGAEYLDVYRFVGATAFAGYGLGHWPLTIWYRRGAGLAIRSTLDAFIYAMLTAGVFGWLWPVA